MNMCVYTTILSMSVLLWDYVCQYHDIIMCVCVTMWLCVSLLLCNYVFLITI